MKTVFFMTLMVFANAAFALSDIRITAVDQSISANRTSSTVTIEFQSCREFDGDDFSVRSEQLSGDAFPTLTVTPNEGLKDCAEPAVARQVRSQVNHLPASRSFFFEEHVIWVNDRIGD